MSGALEFFLDWHNGDCIRQINFQNRLDRPSVLYCLARLAPQIREFALPHVEVWPIVERPIAERLAAKSAPPECPNAVNAWIGQKNVHVAWGWASFFPFLIRFYGSLARKVGVPSPCGVIDRLLMSAEVFERARKVTLPCFDLLLVNSPPKSHQWDYDPKVFAEIALRAQAAGITVVTTERVESVPCTRDLGLSLVGIGALQCRNIVGIDTGPMVATWNELSRDVPRIICHKELNFAWPLTVTVRNNRQLLDAVRRRFGI